MGLDTGVKHRASAEELRILVPTVKPGFFWTGHLDASGYSLCSSFSKLLFLDEIPK